MGCFGFFKLLECDLVLGVLVELLLSAVVSATTVRSLDETGGGGGSRNFQPQAVNDGPLIPKANGFGLIKLTSRDGVVVLLIAESSLTARLFVAWQF